MGPQIIHCKWLPPDTYDIEDVSRRLSALQAKPEYLVNDERVIADGEAVAQAGEDRPTKRRKVYEDVYFTATGVDALASIAEHHAILKEWLFKLDFPCAEATTSTPSPVHVKIVHTERKQIQLKLSSISKPKSRVTFDGTFDIDRDDSLVELIALLPVLNFYYQLRAPPKTKNTCFHATVSCKAGSATPELNIQLLWRYGTLPTDQTSKKHIYLLERYLPGSPPEGKDLGNPRNFYGALHIPPETKENSAEITNEHVTCDLFPFQRRAVRWLLGREGVELKSDGSVVAVAELESLPRTSIATVDANGKKCYRDFFLDVLFKEASDERLVSHSLRGGILAEEMGLGKTVEMISLITLNQRSQDTSPRVPGLVSTGATLIICPPSILSQWMQEIKRHAPGLEVYRYKGAADRVDCEGGLVKMLASKDVVLTTYGVLSSEIWFARPPPDRKLRARKRKPLPRSPLVQILWWRVCLDEAQMIESGVSQAAEVACLIPRINAWAVSGTPLRKDISDLFGLLLFLNCRPFYHLWDKIGPVHNESLRQLFGTIALRHTKIQVGKELRLPKQNRYVIAMPFNAVEEENYRSQFEYMCTILGVNADGGRLREDGDLNDPATVGAMRSWLTRLRRTCLHPELASSKVAGLRFSRVLRSVDDVLNGMVEQNEQSIRTEQRKKLSSQLRRGQLYENAKMSREALALWEDALEQATVIVKECRARVTEEIKKAGADAVHISAMDNDSSDDHDNNSEKVKQVGLARNTFRSALLIEHVCRFFIGNAWFQLKEPLPEDSEERLAFEKKEQDSYEAAKQNRQEILRGISQNVEKQMRRVIEKSKKDDFVTIPQLELPEDLNVIEGRRLSDRLEDFCDAMNAQAEQFVAFRKEMIDLVQKALIDEHKDEDLAGDEYEISTKVQDTMYVYMEALRALLADRHDALTGQSNTLIAHEMSLAYRRAKDDKEGADPETFIRLMDIRKQVKPKAEFGSLRGHLTDLRSLIINLEGRNSRAELALAEDTLNAMQKANSEQTKIMAALVKEVDMFRETMNIRLEYYRQLQRISDTVAPFEPEDELPDTDGIRPLNQRLFDEMARQERVMDTQIAEFESKRRFLEHLRDDSGDRECLICNSDIEAGILIKCGHKFCLECLDEWYKAHKRCPICRKDFKWNRADTNHISYRSKTVLVHEEKTSSPPERRESVSSSTTDSNGIGSTGVRTIYSKITSASLKEIQNTVPKLPESRKASSSKAMDTAITYEAAPKIQFFSTKVDFLARHILWIRAHNPNAKTIIFSQYRDFLMMVSRALSYFGIQHSSIDDSPRSSTNHSFSGGGINAFLTDPSTVAFLLHARAHSSGLNLINATHVILCEPLVNAALELQAIARVHRIGQKHETNVWMYLVQGTVEERVYEIGVKRRMEHLVRRKREYEDADATSNGISPSKGKGRATTPMQDLELEETIENANTLELQETVFKDLLEKGTDKDGVAGGRGEMVQKEDLWGCLFGTGMGSGEGGQMDAVEIE